MGGAPAEKEFTNPQEEDWQYKAAGNQSTRWSNTININGKWQSKVWDTCAQEEKFIRDPQEITKDLEPPCKESYRGDTELNHSIEITGGLSYHLNNQNQEAPLNEFREG